MKKMKTKILVTILAMLFATLLYSPVAHAATKTAAIKTLPTSASVVLGDTATITGKLTTKTGYITTDVITGKLSITSITHKNNSTTFTIKVKGNYTCTSKIRVRSYRDSKHKKLVSTKYISIKTVAPKLNLTKKSITEGSTFTLSMPNVHKTVSVKNGNSKVLKITRKSNKSFTIKVLKGYYKSIPVKLTLGSKTLTCNVTPKCKTHSYKKVITTPATCTEEGLATYTCSDCKKTYTKVIKVTEHSYKKVITTPATCTEDGLATYTCSDCKKTYTEAITALGHDYDEGIVTKEATCTEEGLKTCTCKRCGDKTEQTIPVIKHDYEVDKSATQTEWVSTGKKWVVDTKASTEAEIYGDGYVFCNSCGERWYFDPLYNQTNYNALKTTWVEEFPGNILETLYGWTAGSTLDPITHLGSTAIDPTSHTEWYAKWGNLYQAVISRKQAYESWYWHIDACNHVFGNGGYSDYKAKNPTVIQTKETGHYEDSGYYKTTNTYVCKDCGKTKTESTDSCNHTYDKGKITKQPTCTADGIKTYTCTECGETKTETVPKTHEWVETSGYYKNYDAYIQCDDCGEKWYFSYIKPEGDTNLDRDIDDYGKPTGEYTLKSPQDLASAIIKYQITPHNEQYHDSKATYSYHYAKDKDKVYELEESTCKCKACGETKTEYTVTEWDREEWENS